MKPGYKTTEFWLTVVAQVLALLVMFGVVTPEESDTVTTGLGEAVEAAGPFVVSVVSLVAYIWGRAKVKSEFGKTNVVELNAMLEE